MQKAIEAGKHVLSENRSHLPKKSEVLYTSAKEKFGAHGSCKSSILSGFQQPYQCRKSGKIGDIVDVEASFTRLADPLSRERTDAEYGGAFLEFGPSVLVPVIKLMGKRLHISYF